MKFLDQILNEAKKQDGTLSFQINGNSEFDEVFFGGNTSWIITDDSLHIVEDISSSEEPKKDLYRSILFRLDKIDSVIEA